MIRIEGDNVEVEGNLVDLLSDGAKMLAHLYVIAAERMGHRWAREYVLHRIPQMVEDSIGENK